MSVFKGMNLLTRNLMQALLPLLVALLAGNLQADVLHLVSGDRLSGDIDSVSGGKVILKTEFAGTLGVKLDTIKHMESETVFEIRQADGTKVRGQFAVTADAQQFRADDGNIGDLDLASVKNANENKLGLADLGSDWSNRFDAGISASSGNTDTAAQNYLFESVLTQQRSDHRLLITFDTQEDDGVTTKEKIVSGYRYRRFFGERWYGLGNIGYFQDKFKGVDSRWTLGAGGGYQFWDDSTGALSTDLALNYVIEELEGIEEENPALRWGLEWNRFIMSKKAEFFYLHSVLFIPENNRGTIYNGSTGIRFNLTDMLTANFRFDLAHETDPPEGRKKTDLTYVIGIGLTL